MSKLRWNDKEKLVLRGSLEEIWGCVKPQHATVGAVMAGVAATRNTVFVDPEDIAVYRGSR